MYSRLFFIFALVFPCFIFSFSTESELILNPPLELEHMEDDPMDEFTNWYLHAGLELPPNQESIAILSTCSKEGDPLCSTICIKEVSPESLLFYGDMHNQKGANLKENPKACLMFSWPQLQRNVRICGEAKKLDKEALQKLYAKRSLSSQASSEIVHRKKESGEQARYQVLQKELKEELARNPEYTKAPESWELYSIQPQRVDFTTHGPHSLNSRVSYTKQEDDSWEKSEEYP